MTRNPRNDFEGFKAPSGGGVPTNWALLLALAAICVAAAMAGWMLVFYLVVSSNAMIGQILLPLVAGGASGFIMNRLGVELANAGCMAACIATGLGCILGDQLQIIVFTGEPLGVLYGDQLTTTIYTTVNIGKAILIAIAVWMTYIISKPRTFQPQLA